jgi:hypothetical protein
VNEAIGWRLHKPKFKIDRTEERRMNNLRRKKPEGIVTKRAPHRNDFAEFAAQLAITRQGTKELPFVRVIEFAIGKEM